MNDTGPSETECLRRGQQGDADAFGSLFRAHATAAVRTAYAITRDWAAAEDAVQEAFVRAFRSLPRFRLGEPFAPWLYRLVVNEARRIAGRRRPPAVSRDGPAATPDPEAVLFAREEQRRIWAALGELSPDHRAVLVLKYLRGFSEMEAAVALGVAPQTVKSRLYKARRRLAARLDREGEEDHV